MIIRFYNYIYYRIYCAICNLHIRQNQFLRIDSKVEINYVYVYCARYLGCIISINSISLLLLLYVLLNPLLPKFYFLSGTTFFIIGIVLCLVMSGIYHDKELFEILKKEYKNEKNKKIKGWLVFFYICFSVIAFFVLCNYYSRIL